MASQQEIRRRSSTVDRAPVDSGTVAAAAASATAFATPPDSRPSSSSRAHHTKTMSIQSINASTNRNSADSMPPPPASQDDAPASNRPSRSTSVTSRQVNRLSLTLPVALPTSDPSRPIPPSAGLSSVPATPIDKAAMVSPTDPNDFIIAIATQERRVLELREELARAESELSSLKRRWTTQEAYHKRAAGQNAEQHRQGIAGSDEMLAAQRSADIDRRKLMLQTQNTPTQSRRRVMRGGHTRTLSLLSPTKTEPDFSLHEDLKQEDPILSPLSRPTPQPINPNLAKRASWQPRSHSHSKSSVGVPQIVEDFRLGLRAFVEDIRQITVGDEPVSGSTPQPNPGSYEDNPTNKEMPGDMSKARPTHAARSRVSTAFDFPGQAAASPTPTSRTQDPSGRERSKTGKSKHFSWTPLGFDALDDNDWSNWESPMSTKSARWSGSTINSAGTEEIQSIPEAGEETSTPSKSRLIDTDTPIRSPKLEELLPNMVNRLTPSNIKRTANNLMDEWEKSLVAPGERDKENRA